jgi:hypothetical protein
LAVREEQLFKKASLFGLFDNQTLFAKVGSARFLFSCGLILSQVSFLGSTRPSNRAFKQGRRRPKQGWRSPQQGWKV